MIIIGIDHGYYAIKTRQVSFPSGIIRYDYEPYTMQNVLQYQGKYYVCGTGRQTLVKNKTSNDNYYLLTLAAIAEEIKHRKAERKTEVILAVGLPLSSFGREKQGFREYLLRKEQPVRFLYESELYEITIKDVKLFPQGYSALALHPEYLKNEPSVLLVDIGGWTVDLMRLDNAVPNAATCRSLELGVIRCIDETAEQVRRNTGLSVTETQIERVLRGESCSMAEEARRIIQENGRKYIERILSAVTESGFDLRAVPTVFMGGGSTRLTRMLKEQRPMKFFTVPGDRLKEFAKEAKARGILYVVIKDKVNPDQTEVMVFADDAAKMNRVLDRMNLDFVKAESGSMVTEAVEKETAPEKAENQMEKETGENVRTETVVLPEGKIEFELDDAEEMFQIGDEAFPEGNFTQAQEGEEKNPSEPFSRNRNTSSDREISWKEKNEKPSVRKELGDIRKEQEEKRKRPDRRKNARESRKKRKNMKTKGR